MSVRERVAERGCRGSGGSGWAVVGREVCCAVGGLEGGGAERVELSFRRLGGKRVGARDRARKALSLDGRRVRLSIMADRKESSKGG